MTVIDNAIRNARKKLIKKAMVSGLYENFGQREVRALLDKAGKTYQNEYSSEAKPEYQKIRDFERWASTFDQNALENEKKTIMV